MFVQGNVAVGGLAIDDDNELFVDGNIAATEILQHFSHRMKDLKIILLELKTDYQL